jgi:hypothetical protein
MTIAGGMGLIILGAILRYAVTWHSSWIDVGKVGQILIIGGSASLAVGIALHWLRRRSHARSKVYEQRYHEEPPQ